MRRTSRLFLKTEVIAMVMESITGDQSVEALSSKKYEIEAEYRVGPVQIYKVVHGSTMR